MSSLKKALLATLSVSAIVVTDTAVAQSLFTRDRNVSVLQRSRPEYDPTGIRAGSFIIRPKLDLMAGYSDNVFAIGENEEIPVDEGGTLAAEGDGYFIFRPSVRAESDWNRHALVVGSYLEASQHVDFDENEVINGGVFADSRIDIRRQLAVTTGGSYDVLHESRKTTSQSFLADEPVEYKLGTAYVGLEHELGRVRYRGRLNIRNFDFDDGISFVDDSVIDQDFRDRTEYSVLMQAGFAVTRDASVFLRGIYRDNEYDNHVAGRLDRGSQGYTIETGVDFDISRLMRGSVAIGYLHEEFDDESLDPATLEPRLEDVDGVSFDAGIEYFPTQRVTMRLSGSRGVRASALADSTSYLSSDVLLGVDVEVMRNLILSASAGYGTSEYQGSDREEERFGASLGATYLINRYLRSELTYTHEQQDASFTAPGIDDPFLRDYEINEILLKLTAER